MQAHGDPRAAADRVKGGKVAVSCCHQNFGGCHIVFVCIFIDVVLHTRLNNYEGCCAVSERPTWAEQNSSMLGGAAYMPNPMARPYVMRPASRMSRLGAVNILTAAAAAEHTALGFKIYQEPSLLRLKL